MEVSKPLQLAKMLQPCRCPIVVRALPRYESENLSCPILETVGATPGDDVCIVEIGAETHEVVMDA